MANLIPFPPQPEPPEPPTGAGPQNEPDPVSGPVRAPSSDVVEFKRPEGPRPRPKAGLGAPSFLRFLRRVGQSAKISQWPRSPSLWIRCTQAILLAVAVCFSMGATNAGPRLQYLDHHLMCTCGCAELLGECNHVGCTESTQELAELRGYIAAGLTDQQIFDAFVSKYGATVLAAPPAKGFDLVAWIAPFAVLAAALLGTILLIRRWGGMRGFKPPSADADLAGADFSALDPADRERREKIRRETEMDAGLDPGSGLDGGTTR